WLRPAAWRPGPRSGAPACDRLCSAACPARLFAFQWLAPPTSAATSPLISGSPHIDCQDSSSFTNSCQGNRIAPSTEVATRFANCFPLSLPSTTAMCGFVAVVALVLLKHQDRL